MILALGSTQVIAFVSGVLGLAVLLGGVIAVLFSQLRKNTTQIVREENEDLRKRLKTVEEQEETCRERLSALEATSKQLVDMLTGASVVAELATTVNAHHVEVVKMLDDLNKRIDARET